MSNTNTTTSTDDMECPVNNKSMLVDRIGCILSYGGSTLDMWINYLLLAANLFWCLQIVLRKRRPPPGVGRYQVFSLIGVGLFQIVLCLLLGCSGISIVWCALAGWALREEVLLYPQELRQEDANAFMPLRRRGGRWGWLVEINDKIWPNAAALVYYGVVAPPITTVAHGCALALGYLISYGESLGFDPPAREGVLQPLDGTSNHNGNYQIVLPQHSTNNAS